MEDTRTTAGPNEWQPINTDVRLGLLCWNQYTDWQSLLVAGIRADELGFYSLWTWDHLNPIVGSDRGPFFEGYLTLAAWAQATSRVRVGLMVGANPFRYPTLTAKMATTLDHISGGRAYLGIGSAWNEDEARGFGIEFGESPAERLRWLREALPIMRGMLHGESPSAAGPRYFADEVRNDPVPVQSHLPLLIGGGGEKVTLRLVARYGDATNIGFAAGLESFKRKEAALRAHCDDLGRDHREIERTINTGPIVVRDSTDDAVRELERIYEHNGAAKQWSGRPASEQPTGSPEHVVEVLLPFVEQGYRHIVIGAPAPYDEETMERLVREVQPKLQAAVSAVGVSAG
jgi:alkanesulfonate monooxygenase SsuD/methylene tetrahydromethanopterin reductase-like flavin-dependent oxidoreductase (luciferase family)